MTNTKTGKECIRLWLSVNFKSGYTLKALVNYAHISSGKLYYTADKKVYERFMDQVSLPLELIDTFDLYPVICRGWDPIGDEKPGYYAPTGERI